MVFKYLMPKTPCFFWHPAKQSRPALANAEEVVLTARSPPPPSVAIREAAKFSMGKNGDFKSKNGDFHGILI